MEYLETLSLLTTYAMEPKVVHWLDVQWSLSLIWYDFYIPSTLCVQEKELCWVASKCSVMYIPILLSCKATSCWTLSRCVCVFTSWYGLCWLHMKHRHASFPAAGHIDLNCMVGTSCCNNCSLFSWPVMVKGWGVTASAATCKWHLDTGPILFRITGCVWTQDWWKFCCEISRYRFVTLQISSVLVMYRRRAPVHCLNYKPSLTHMCAARLDLDNLEWNHYLWSINQEMDLRLPWQVHIVPLCEVCMCYWLSLCIYSRAWVCNLEKHSYELW